MSKQPLSRTTTDIDAFAKSIKGETLAYAQVFEQIRSQIPYAEALITTSLPRGSLQIAQPQRLAEPIVRGYSRDAHGGTASLGGPSKKGAPFAARIAGRRGSLKARNSLTSSSPPTAFDTPRRRHWPAPVFEGYPGALHLYRTADQGPFSEHELSELTEIAHKLGDAIAQTRHRAAPGRRWRPNG